jgi:hypothetical protein
MAPVAKDKFKRGRRPTDRRINGGNPRPGTDMDWQKGEGVDSGCRHGGQATPGARPGR